MLRCSTILILLLLCCAVLVGRPRVSSPSHENLQSFYVVRLYFSDHTPGWFNQILDVTPQGADVRIRVIRISRANDFCPGLIVRAAERVIPHASVGEIAGTEICDLSSEKVNAALKAAASNSGADVSGSATETLVATCGNTPRKFDFPYPAEVDETTLQSTIPEIWELWDTSNRVIQRTFGKGFSFNALSSEKETEMEQLGTRAVSELISGKYQAAYAGAKCGNQECGNYLAWQLKGYIEAPREISPSVVTLQEANSLPFTHFVLPVMPWIALVARVSGDVRLRIFVDHQTGSVTNVQPIAGAPALTKAAVDAAQSWRFAPESMTGEPFEVTVRFELKCPQ